MSCLKKIAVLYLLMYSSSLMAALVEVDSNHLEAPSLNEVVVSSSKNDSKLKNIPASISVLTPTELSNLNIHGIKDISAVIPNLFFPDYGSKLTSPVYIRGIGSKINAPSIGLYVDGIPYFDKSVFDFEWDDVERVEVLRGPQGTLFGRNTMGGIIQIVTKNPLEYQGGKLSLTGGNYEKRELSASYYNKILPGLGYALSGKYNHSDGFFVNQHTGETADKLDALCGSGKLVWNPSKTLSLQWIVRYDRLRQNGYPYALIDSLGKIGTVNYDSVSSYNRDLLSGAWIVRKSFNHFILKSVTSLQTTSDLQAIDQDFSVKPTTFVTQKQQQKLWTEELTAHSIDSERYNWILGAFAFKQSTTNHLKVNTYTSQGASNPLKVNTVLKDYDLPSEGLAFYHQSTFNLLANLAFVAGLRYDYEKGSQKYLYQVPVAGALQVKANLFTVLSFSEWSPKVSLQFKENNDNTMYASVSKGYKTGGFNTSFDTKDEQTFKPEFSWNYELGQKYSLCNQQFSGEFAFFFTDWRNQQISQPASTLKGSLLRNAGRSYSQGAEFALRAQVTERWNANLSYGYTEAKFVDYSSGENDYSNHYIPYIPKHTLLLGTDYTVPVHKQYLNQAVFSCQYVETGKLYWNDANSAWQDRYGVVNGNLSLTCRRVKLDFWVRNISSTPYAAFYFETGGNKLGQKGKPRTQGMTLTLLIP